MIELAHGDTPFHDDPGFWMLLVAAGGPLAAISFGLHWLRTSVRDRMSVTFRSETNQEELTQ